MAETEATGPTEADAEQSATRALCGVLDLPGLAAGAAAVLAPPLGQAMFALVAPLDTVKNAAGLGRRLLNVATSVTARDTTPISSVLPGEPDRPPQAGVNTTPPPWPSLIADLVAELIDDHTPGSPDAREAHRVLREIGRFVVDLQSQVVAGAMVGQLPQNTIKRAIDENVKRLLKLKKLMDKLEKFFPTLTAPRFRKALKNMGIELKGAAADRALIAAFMSVPGFLADLATAPSTLSSEVPSTLALGREIEKILQKRYRSQWRSRFIGQSLKPYLRGPIVQDDRVYQNPILGVSLTSYAETTRDGAVQALLIARVPAYLFAQHLLGELPHDMWGEYREDTLDMRLAELWEIKPMRSAAIGVFQEFHYRHSFNIVYALLQDVAEIFAAGGGKKGKLGKRAAFLKGFDFSRPVSLVPGLDLAWAGLKQPETVGGKKGSKTLLAVPLTVPQLPGLLLYVLLDIPLPALLAFSAFLAKKLQEAIEQMARDYARDVERILEALAKVALEILAKIGMAIVFVLFWEALLAGGAAVAALVQLLIRFAPGFLPAFGLIESPAGGGQIVQSQQQTTDPAAFVQKLLQAARAANLVPLSSARMVGDELVVQLAPINQSQDPPIPIIDIAMGPLRVCGIPAAARPIIDLLAQAGAAVGAGAFSEFVGESLKQA